MTSLQTVQASLDSVLHKLRKALSPPQASMQNNRFAKIVSSCPSVAYLEMNLGRLQHAADQGGNKGSTT